MKIVSPAREGSKRIVSPGFATRVVAHCSEPKAPLPSALVTITTLGVRPLAFCTDGEADGAVGGGVSSAHAAIATRPRRMSGSDRRPAREVTACIEVFPWLEVITAHPQAQPTADSSHYVQPMSICVIALQD